MRRGGLGGLESKEPWRKIRIGRWSEFMVVRVHHLRSENIAGVDIERSGDEELPKEGSLVG